MLKPALLLLAFSIHEACAICFVAKNETASKQEIDLKGKVVTDSIQCRSMCAEEPDCYAFVYPNHTGCHLLLDVNKNMEQCIRPYLVWLKKTDPAECPNEISSSVDPGASTTSPKVTFLQTTVVNKPTTTTKEPVAAGQILNMDQSPLTPYTIMEGEAVLDPAKFKNAKSVFIVAVAGCSLEIIPWTGESILVDGGEAGEQASVSIDGVRSTIARCS